MHPRDRLFQSLVDGELSPDREAGILSHAASCERCAARFARVRSLAASFSGFVLDIDAAEPASWLGAQDDAIAALAEAGRPALRVERGAVSDRASAASAAAHSARARRFVAPASLRWAALFVFGTAAIGAAALIMGRFPPTAGEDPAQVLQQVPAETRAGTQAIAGAVVVQPVAGAVSVRVLDPGAGSMLFVEWSDASSVAVQVEGSATPRFEARDGSVEVSLDGSTATVRVTLPRTLRSAELRTREGVLARARDGRLDPPEAASGLRIR